MRFTAGRTYSGTTAILGTVTPSIEVASICNPDGWEPLWDTSPHSGSEPWKCHVVDNRHQLKCMSNAENSIVDWTVIYFTLVPQCRLELVNYFGVTMTGEDMVQGTDFEFQPGPPGSQHMLNPERYKTLSRTTFQTGFPYYDLVTGAYVGVNAKTVYQKVFNRYFKLNYHFAAPNLGSAAGNEKHWVDELIEFGDYPLNKFVYVAIFNNDIDAGEGQCSYSYSCTSKLGVSR